jgi:hypothetical protein
MTKSRDRRRSSLQSACEGVTKPRDHSYMLGSERFINAWLCRSSLRQQREINIIIRLAELLFILTGMLPNPLTHHIRIPRGLLLVCLGSLVTGTPSSPMTTGAALPWTCLVYRTKPYLLDGWVSAEGECLHPSFAKVREDGQDDTPDVGESR